MHFTREQRDAWHADTQNSPFNRWLRDRTVGADGLLDLDSLRSVAAEFGVDAEKYAHLNAGQQRMNVGNRLRRVVPRHVYDPGSGQMDVQLISRPAPIPTAAEAAPSEWPFMTTATISDLLRTQAAAIEELRRRGVVRTGNAPLGDYAEHLFARAFHWKLTPNSATSYDAENGDGIRFQIKARRLRTEAPGERQLGVMRALPDAGFDYLAAILFNRDFSVRRAALVPHAMVLARAVHVRHVNGWRFILDDAVWLLEGVQDVTSSLRSAAEALNDEAVQNSSRDMM